MHKFLKISIKILSVFLMFVFIVSIVDMTSISTKYINRAIITIDVNNIRNPQIKKIVRKLDLFLGDIYFKLSKKKTKRILFTRY